MNKITSIHLNGKAFQLEEAAYDNLQSYLKESETKLADNPDKQEIMADLEQAVADKCTARLHTGKDVVTVQEMNDILKEMGRVEPSESESRADADGDGTDDGASTGPKPKRLYNIPEGAMIAGVCNGLAAYFNIDVMLVRALFIIATFITGGSAILAYIILALVVPEAKTKGQIAEATGRPLTAQEIVENGKQRLQEVSESVRKTGAARNILKILLIVAVVLMLFALLRALWVFVSPWHWGPWGY